MINHIVVRLALPLIMISALTACGGGGGGSGSGGSSSTPISGGGVKGPLANAVVTVFTFDASQPGFQGAVVTTATTNNAAAITGLELPLPVSPPYIMEFTSVAGTTDITTGLAPVIATLRTVITQSLLDGGEPIYATPLTTMAVDIAVMNAADTNGTAGIQADEFAAALSVAATQVVSTVGFGMSGDIDIFDVPPLVDSTTTTTAQQADVAAYRTAVEALTAVVFQMQQQSSAGADVDAVLSELANDLADGNIDGNVSGAPSTIFTATTLDVLAQDPASLPIPNSPSGQTVADVQAILVSETATTGATTTTTALAAGGSINTVVQPAATNPDIDGDGTPNATDAFPQNPGESTDTDGDGIGDGSDPDIDGNGILNEDEGTPPVTTATDTDGDTILDGADNCPVDFNTSQTDTDGDGTGNACDADNDNDGTPDIADQFPLDANEQTDTDGDGTGDVADLDDDNDGLSDTAEDAAPADPDGDGIPNRQDTDSDNDGVLDSVDFAPYDSAITFNNAPISTNSSVTTDEDSAVAVTLSANDDGAAPGPLVFTITDPANGVLSGTAPNLTYTPNAEFNDSDSFTFTATDGAGAVSNVATVSITVNAVNDAPVIAQAGPLEVTMDEDGAPIAFAAPTITATDVDSATLTWSGTAATNGTATVSGTGASPTITYVPNADFDGTDNFNVTVSDGSGGSDTITVNVTIAAQNDLPTIAGIPPTTATEGVAYSFTPIADDVDGEALTFSIQNQPSWAGFNPADGTLSGTPDVADVDTADFTNIIISVTAGGETVALPAFSITVNPSAAGPAVWDLFNWDDGSTWQ